MKKSSPRRFQILLAVILLAIGAYVGYWFFALDQAKKGFAALEEAEKARGNTLAYATIEWSGFPTRLSVEMTGFFYEAGDVQIMAQQVKAEAMPWNPTHMLVRADASPMLQLMDVAQGERLVIKPEMLLASIRVTPEGGLNGADIEMRRLMVEATTRQGRTVMAAARLQLDSRLFAAAPANAPATSMAYETHDIALSADAVRLMDGFDPLLQPTIAQVRMAARLTNLPPISKGYQPSDIASGVAMLADNGVKAEIARLDMDWLGVPLRGKGTVQLDAQHRLAGQIDITGNGFVKLLDVLLKTGVLQGPDATNAGFKDGDSVPLRLENGEANFGPFYMGQLEPLG